MGETGDIRRFRSPAAFARHNGTAPVPASSGTGADGPQRLNRGGNRQLNAATHRIAVVQARCYPGAAALLRLNGLIRRLPHTNRYVLTDDGIRIAVFCTKV